MYTLDFIYVQDLIDAYDMTCSGSDYVPDLIWKLLSGC